MEHESEKARIFRIKNRHGMEARLSSYGACVLSLLHRDARGRRADLVLGFKRRIDYALGAERPYFGATIGRFANRIAGARIRLGKKAFRLGSNGKGCTLHGGKIGFDRRLWEGRPIRGKGWRGVAFRLFSPDGEEGFPGDLRVEVQYRLSDLNELIFLAWAKAGKATPVSLCHHGYFNLSGESSGPVLDAHLRLQAGAYLPLDRHSIPTGEIRPVAGTPFDFRSLRPIGRGYDHNFVLSRRFIPGELRFAAELSDPRSGRRMEVWTDMPGIQVYTGNKLAGQAPGKNGKPYGNFAGIALETQHFPDSPNRPGFPSPWIKAGQIFRTKTIYRFRP